jgi:hypothetical protein
VLFIQRGKAAKPTIVQGEGRGGEGKKRGWGDNSRQWVDKPIFPFILYHNLNNNQLFLFPSVVQTMLSSFVLFCFAFVGLLIV